MDMQLLNLINSSSVRQLLDLEEVKWGDDFISTDDLERLNKRVYPTFLIKALIKPLR